MLKGYIVRYQALELLRARNYNVLAFKGSDLFAGRSISLFDRPA